MKARTRAKSGAALKGAARDDEALRLRLHEGKEFREIAEALNYRTASDARRAVDRAIRRLPKQEEEQYRQMMTERLEHLYVLAYKKAQKDVGAIKIAAGIVSEQVKLNGLKGAKGTEAGGKGGAQISITTAREVLEAIQRGKKGGVR
jgi:Tfp pilus assembly pilus retraction ATPase PilT